MHFQRLLNVVWRSGHFREWVYNHMAKVSSPHLDRLDSEKQITILRVRGNGLMKLVAGGPDPVTVQNIDVALTIILASGQSQRTLIQSVSPFSPRTPWARCATIASSSNLKIKSF
jgi:hypothetical protein